MIFTRYDRRTGIILGTMFNIDPSTLPAKEGIIRGTWSPDVYWVRRRRAVPLAAMTLSIDGRTILGAPKGTQAWLRGTQVGVTACWTPPDDIHIVRLECPGFLPQTIDLAPHRTLRADAYPAVGDQLDAIAKGFEALASAGIALPAETLAWLAALRAVKAAHPRD